jgi:cadherin 20 type 2
MFCTLSVYMYLTRLLSLSVPDVDNTAWILTRRGGWSQQDQSVYYLPIFISDGEQPVQTSTSTLTIRVCSCDVEGNVMSCNAEAYHLPASLSRGALIAILACIFVMLGRS